MSRKDKRENKMKTLKFFPFVILIIGLTIMTSCEKENVVEYSLLESSVTNSSVEPELASRPRNGGNITCSEAAATEEGAGEYEYTTGRQDYPFAPGSFDGMVSVTTDGTHVTWSITPPDGYCVANVAVIVKGGPAANVYYYNDGESGDSGLTAPVNASGNPAGLSNLTICYNLVECDTQTCDWQEETAYGGGIEGEGNAWWYALDASASGTYPIYAGQQAVPGASITYDASTDLITINLGTNMQLQNVDEPVKAEGYNTLPSMRPASGQFELYKGSDLSIQGNGSAFYVVHLDAEVCN